MLGFPIRVDVLLTLPMPSTLREIGTLTFCTVMDRHARRQGPEEAFHVYTLRNIFTHSKIICGKRASSYSLAVASPPPPRKICCRFPHGQTGTRTAPLWSPTTHYPRFLRHTCMSRSRPEGTGKHNEADIDRVRGEVSILGNCMYSRIVSPLYIYYYRKVALEEPKPTGNCGNALVCHKISVWLIHGSKKGESLLSLAGAFETYRLVHLDPRQLLMRCDTGDTLFLRFLST